MPVIADVSGIRGPMRLLISAFISLIIGGCAFHEGPKDNHEFIKITSPHQLDGVFKNEGDPNGQLSRIIWSGDTLGVNENGNEILHHEIDLISVSSIEKSLIVKAIIESCVVAEKEYVLGKDFEIKNGKISWIKDVSLLTRGPGDPLVGPGYSWEDIGIDTEGNGKFRTGEYYAGLVYLIFPVALSGKTDIRFEKTNVDKEYFSCE